MLFLERFAGSVWSMLVDSAFLLLVGVFLAGLLHLLLNEKSVKRFLSGSGRSSIFKATLVGIPLPLCSCSVLPVAGQLRQSGLSEGGTAAFLVATPETGVDSILLTYSLTDPLMTVARPVTAFVSAVAAGLWVHPSSQGESLAVEAEAPSCHHCGHEAEETVVENKSFVRRISGGIRYAFMELMGEFAPYLFIGYLLAGLVAVLLGGDATTLPELFRTGWGGYLGAMVIGLPLYVCATSSTPLAAALLAAGFSHGAVLVFLLVGPATNLASLAVVKKILGNWSTVRYLAAIVIVSLIFGVGLDALYRALDFSPVYLTGEHHGAAGVVAKVSAVLLAIHLTFLTVRKLARKLT